MKKILVVILALMFACMFVGSANATLGDPPDTDAGSTYVDIPDTNPTTGDLTSDGFPAYTVDPADSLPVDTSASLSAISPAVNGIATDASAQSTNAPGSSGCNTFQTWSKVGANQASPGGTWHQQADVRTAFCSGKMSVIGVTYRIFRGDQDCDNEVAEQIRSFTMNMDDIANWNPPSYTWKCARGTLSASFAPSAPKPIHSGMTHDNRCFYVTVDLDITDLVYGPAPDKHYTSTEKCIIGS